MQLSSIASMLSGAPAFETNLWSILQATGNHLGAFELNHSNRTVSYTPNLLPLLCLNNSFGQNLGYQSFGLLLEGLEQYRHGDTLFCLSSASEERWLDICIANSEKSTCGIVYDISNYMHICKQLEIQRDYDALTGLYNRGGFFRHFSLLENTPKQLQFGALLLLDLDNLKTANDTYGHAFGDMYLKTTGEAITQFHSSNTLCARIGGDEFLLFIYGSSSTEELHNTIHDFKTHLSRICLPLPNGELQPLQVSIGISYFPQDSSSLDGLICTADQAMYQAKRSKKAPARTADRHENSVFEK